MHIKFRFLGKKEAKRLFLEFSFSNTVAEKLHIKCLQDMDFLHELPFYDKLNIEKISKGFRRYARSYKIEIIDSKDPLVQLEASKSNIKDLFKDLLDEMKGFKYQIIVKVLLRKHK